MDQDYAFQEYDSRLYVIVHYFSCYALVKMKIEFLQ